MDDLSYILLARLQQATEERDRMIEATNELRADMRRLERQVEQVPEAKPDKVPSAASAPSVPSPMSAASVMRQALAFVGGMNSDSSGGGALVDRFGALSSPPRSPHSIRSPALPLPGPMAFEPSRHIHTEIKWVDARDGSTHEPYALDAGDA
ncbi:hypothetical protein AK812_SmicGene1795 [Symbiodinium microadriaticum]|uniref:Uncharacterized protein n=1 Tax=Symbiodinium microadriaticum TaxID=2951 RepID=A0A1Q9F3A7_SYMMI|nr:hypothetical protein AK812_SmicGene1795 [Symbiodinium microadriaticum]